MDTTPAPITATGSRAGRLAADRAWAAKYRAAERAPAESARRLAKRERRAARNVRNVRNAPRGE